MNERELRAALREAAPEDPPARDRAWDVVRAGYRARPLEPAMRRRGRWARVAFAATVLVAAGAAGAAATAPRSDVGRFVRDVIGVGEPSPHRTLVRLPGGGRVLVEAGRRAWVVSADGSRRSLGPYAGASWSPRGLFLVAWRGSVLTAVEPSGEVRWSLSRPGRITHARWSTGDGFRIAYVVDGTLRIVNGDGTDDRLHASADPGVSPAWRPRSTHVVAYADRRGRVTVTAVDSGRRVWRRGVPSPPAQLAWSPRGDRLLVATRRHLVLFDGSGRRLASRAISGQPVGVSWSPGGRAFALVRHQTAAAASELLLVRASAGLPHRLVFSGPGRFGAPAWSPDGRTVLLPWPEADQWLFLRPGRRGRPTAVGDIARQFSPDAMRPPFPRTVRWCAC